jgi:hypothetical protein
MAALFLTGSGEESSMSKSRDMEIPMLLTAISIQLGSF